MRDVLGIAFDAASWEEAVACAQGDASASDTAHTTGAGFLARLLIAAVPICVLAHSDAVSDAVHEWRAAHHVASASPSGFQQPDSAETYSSLLARGTPVSQAAQSPAHATRMQHQPQKRWTRT